MNCEKEERVNKFLSKWLLVDIPVHVGSHSLSSFLHSTITKHRRLVDTSFSTDSENLK